MDPLHLALCAYSHTPNDILWSCGWLGSTRPAQGACFLLGFCHLSVTLLTHTSPKALSIPPRAFVSPCLTQKISQTNSPCFLRNPYLRYFSQFPKVVISTRAVFHSPCTTDRRPSARFSIHWPSKKLCVTAWEQICTCGTRPRENGMADISPVFLTISHGAPFQNWAVQS